MVWTETHRTTDVFVIDPTTNRITDIPYQTNTSDSGVWSISPGPDGVYAVVGLDDVVDRIDVASKSLIPLAHVMGATWALDTPAGLWVGIRGGQGRAPADALVQLDPKSGVERRRVTVGGGGRLFGVGLQMAYGFGSLWVAKDEDERLVRVDPVAGIVTATVALPSTAGTLAAGPSAMYATLDDGSVVRIDPQTNCVTASTSVPSDSGAFASPTADSLYLTYSAGALAILDPVTLATRRSMRIDQQQFSAGVAVGFGSAWFLTFDKDTVLRLKL